MSSDRAKLVFLDTEFTALPSDSKSDGFLPKPRLISLGLVTEAGDHFYAESTDFKTRFCSEFVRRTVLPLMTGPRLSPTALKFSLTQFLLAQPANCQIACDYYFDYELLVRAAGGELPPNLRSTWLDVGFLEREPDAITAVERYFAQGKMRHHALNDAEALRSAWQGFAGS